MMHSAAFLLILCLCCSFQAHTSQECIHDGQCIADEIINVVITRKTRYLTNLLQPMLKRMYALSDSAEINYFVLDSTYFRAEQINQESSGSEFSVLTDKLLYRVDPTAKFGNVTYLTMNDTMSLFRSNNRLVLVAGILDVSLYYKDGDNYYANRSSDMYYDSSESNILLNGMMGMLNTTDVIFVSGEAVDQSDMMIWSAMSNVTTNIHFLSTLTNHDMILPKYVWSSIKLRMTVKYVPVFVTSFGELQLTNNNITAELSLQQSVDGSGISGAQQDESINVHYRHLNLSAEMLLSYPTRDNSVFTDSEGIVETNSIFRMKTDTVGYLYYRCDRVDREQFYDILTAKLLVHQTATHQPSTVVPLGRCAGSKNQSAVGNEELSREYKQSRRGDHYLADAIKRYSAFKFVIAFENSRVPGYITEKLTNAYMAHAIPIYWGAPDVGNYFNERSMINCNHYDTLEECADRVVQVHSDESQYRDMVRQPVLAGENDEERQRIWNDLFIL